MMKAVPLGRYSTVEKDLSCQTFASLSFCFSLSVLQSLMFGSHWYSSSQTTSGGTSPVSLHVMSETRMQFLVFFFFFIRKVGQEHEDFLKRQNDRETQRGERGNEMCKQESFHHICDVLFCLFAGQPSFPRTSSAFCEENRQPTGGQTLSLCYFLSCSFFSTYIYISVCVTAIRK